MSPYEYIRSVIVYSLMLGQPILWTLVINFPDPNIDSQSPAMLIALSAMFAFCGIIGTQIWIWCHQTTSPRKS